MTKRNFLSFAATAMIAMASTPAWGDRIRILPSDRDPTPAAPANALSPELQRVLAGVHVGPAQVQGALVVVWLRAKPAPASPAIATLDEARGAGDLLITERAQATVPGLIVDNRGKRSVLLLAGEILVGGKQNRVVIEDVLLPPLSGPRDLTVYCVEQGRWSASAAKFDARGSFAAPGLRAKVMERADQRSVWSAVSSYATRAAAPSPTASYQAIYDKPEVKERQREAERAFDHRTAPDAIGAAVFVGSTLSGLDLFEDSGLFGRQWAKLLRAQVLESYGQPPAPPDPGPLAQQVEELLRRWAKVEGSLKPSVGVGQLFEVRFDRHRGSALVSENQVVHAALL